MNTQTTTVIEVNGVKLEVDLRTARRVDTLQVGSRVKVLRKSDYGDHKVYPGIVVGFDPFQTLPTINVAYLVTDYSSAKLEFLALNSATKGHEIVASIDKDELEINRSDALQLMDNEIAKHRQAIDELGRRREWFEHHFRAYFADASNGVSA